MGSTPAVEQRLEQPPRERAAVADEPLVYRSPSSLNGSFSGFENTPQSVASSTDIAVIPKTGLRRSFFFHAPSSFESKRPGSSERPPGFPPSNSGW